MSKVDLPGLKAKANSVKRRFLSMYKKANAGHIGSSLSCAEILTTAKFAWMNPDDRLILSKGHAAACLYSVLAENGEIPESEIETFYKNNTSLPAHPPVNRFPGIPFATGSLGHGLPIASGFGMSARLLDNNVATYCVTSDGEIDEGSTWEAALFISQHNLTNVRWIIDRNRLQGYGRTEDIIRLEPLDEKLKSFGFDVHSVDGHVLEQLVALKDIFDNAKLPVAVIANTTKGNGWIKMADTLGCHYLPITDEDYELLHGELNAGNE